MDFQTVCSTLDNLYFQISETTKNVMKVDGVQTITCAMSSILAEKSLSLKCIETDDRRKSNLKSSVGFM